MELPQLLDLVRRGDELAWEAFVRRFQSRVFGLAYHYTAQAEDARDLAQEVFIRIYQNLALVPGEAGCLPWISLSRMIKEIQGLGLEEISAILEVPVGTVKSRSHRARLELAQKLVAVGMGA